MVLKPSAAWLGFAWAAVTVVAMQKLACDFGLCSGVLVGDTVSLARELDNVTDSGTIGYQRLPYIGVVVLYWLNWQLSPFTTIAVNLVLIYLVLRTLDRIFREYPAARTGAFLGVVANPFLWFVASGPNKEIPLLLVTVLYAFAYLKGGRRGVLYALVLAGIAAAFRDGYGALLAGLALLNVVVRTPRNRVVVALFGAIALAVLFDLAATYVPFLKRNLASTEYIAKQYDSPVADLAVSGNSASLAVGLYVFRLAANGFSVPVRPQWFMIDRSVYPLGVAFWVFGVILAGGLIACIWIVISGCSGQGAELAALTLQIVIAVSVSLFVQPRYLMAVLPLSAAVFAGSRLNQTSVVAGSAIFALVVASILMILGITPPLATGVEGDVPSFLRTSQDIS